MTRQKQEDDETGVGASSSVPTAAREKRAKTVVSATGERTHIGATTRKGDVDRAAALAERAADTALSGWKADGIASQRPADDAVRLLETETEVGKDMRSIHERNLEIHKGLKEGTLEAGVYRGLGGYKKYIDMSEGAISSSKYSGLLGPTRNTMSNVRSTLRIEYWGTTGEGGVCKDYKETGYCGWGDTCKFLHDRSDYKPGYILEREWEEKQKALEEKKRKQWERRMARRGLGEARKEEDGEASDASGRAGSDSGSEDLPSVCPICEQKWKDCKSSPVVTVCGHHFCEDCALGHFAESPKCMTCDVPTNGIFNTCEALEARQRRARSGADLTASGSAAPDRGRTD